jgi:hypothetical protein
LLFARTSGRLPRDAGGKLADGYFEAVSELDEHLKPWLSFPSLKKRNLRSMYPD